MFASTGSEDQVCSLGLLIQLFVFFFFPRLVVFVLIVIGGSQKGCFELQLA